MFNYCHHKLTVRGPSDELRKFVEFAEGPVFVTWKDQSEPNPDSPLEPRNPEHTLLSLPKLVPPGEASALLPWQDPKKRPYSSDFDVEELEDWLSDVRS